MHQFERGASSGVLVSALVAAGIVACSSDTTKSSADGGAPEASTGGQGGNGGQGGQAGKGGQPLAEGGTTLPDAGQTFDVTIDSGPIRGKLDGKVRAFLGIPYAAPPTGANRFRAPQPVTPWTAVRNATEASTVCPQNSTGGSAYDPRSDEDCLVLNVFTPDPPPSAPLPVMVWIHGGAFVFGSGVETFYDGGKLVDTANVVVVSINYRLGALGFLALPELTAEAKDHPTSGNYGFEDQQAALRWVKQNIGKFAGDSSQVTIFGESAGGFSVCTHLVAPGSKGLFHRAISESGLCRGFIKGTRDGTYPNGEALASKLGCSGSSVLSCLRGKGAQDFVEAFQGTKPEPGGIFFQGPGAPGDAGADAGIAGSDNWGPVVDGDVVTVPVAEVGPSFAKVPLILGTNRNEGTIFTAAFGGTPVGSSTEYEAALERRFGADTAKVLAEYPAASFPSPNDALSEVSTDALFVCPARRLARGASAAGSPVYLYAFQHAPEMPLLPGLGAYHASEFPFVFGLDDPLAVTQDDEKPLIGFMQGYWGRFAHTGDPNGAGAPPWPKYDATADENLSLDLPTPKTETGHKKDKCDFWEMLGVY